MIYDKVIKLLECYIRKYQEILDQQEPFSESELIAECNNRINELNKIERQVEILELLEGFTDTQIRTFLRVFKADPDYVEFIGEILLEDYNRGDRNY